MGNGIFDSYTKWIIRNQSKKLGIFDFVRIGHRSFLVMLLQSITDVENGKTYEIDYITSRVSETLQLERGRWYEVESAGELIVRLVNIRIE